MKPTVPYRRRRRGRWRMLGYSMLGLLLVLLVALPLGLSDWLLRQALRRGMAQLEARGLLLEAARIEQDGLTGVVLTDVRLRRPNREPLFQAQTLQVTVAPLPLLVGQVRLAHIQVAQGIVRIIACRDSTRNLPLGDTTAVRDTTPATWAERLDRQWQRVQKYWPESASVADLKLVVQTEYGAHEGHVGQAQWTEDSLRAELHWQGQAIRAQGQLQPLDVSLSAPDSLTLTSFPLADRLGLQVAAQHLRVQMPRWESNADAVEAQVQVSALAPEVYHRRLSREAVRLDSLVLDLRWQLVGNRFALDSASTVVVNGVRLQPALVLQTKPDTLVQASLQMAPMPAQQWFDALPPSLFGSVRGLLAEGEVAARWELAYHSQRPDSLYFDGGLQTEGFRVVQYGEQDLRKLNTSFTHRTFRDSRRIVVGDSNPLFVPLDQISPFVKEAVLTSEDGSFYYHKGFNVGAFRSAILDNVRRQRFARGASTISMQLVKNVFLTPEKTLGRKLEEALLVWLIETTRVASKDRMLEVYLNIIEWGPNVYGISEASRFYFGKHPAQIYPTEAIFLAMIIPRPRSFAYAFDSTGNLRSTFHGYYRLLGGLMQRRGIITPEQDSLLIPPLLDLATPARNLVRARFGQPDTLRLEPLLFADPLLDDDLEGLDDGDEEDGR